MGLGGACHLRNGLHLYLLVLKHNLKSTKMAVRRPRSVCLSCQTRKALIGRRRLTTTPRQRLETVAVTPEDDGFILSNTQNDGKKEAENNGPVLPLEASARQWNLGSPVDELREALLGFDALWKRRDLRINVLRSLSNPWPDVPVQGQSTKTLIPKTRIVLPEANAALIPHAVFRRRLYEAMYEKEIRKILRLQFLRCEWPREILRVIAVAMQDAVTAQNVATLVEPIMRALYRCRKNVADPEVLRTLNTVIARFSMAKLPVSPIFPQLGLRFAARCRSLPAMKKYLNIVRENDVEMTANVFRSVIAKFSIGHRGLGEIRNGRWRRDQLIQVLKGFDDATDLPLEQQYHLGSWLIREDWQYLHGWVAVLSRCRDSDGVWKEWELWKESAARTQPKKLGGQKSEMTSKKRGDYWFVEQMTFSGDLKRAWQILAETGLPFGTLHERVRMRLLEGVEYATILDEDVRNAMMQKYDTDLSKIEEALGVRWVLDASGEDGEGTHEVVGSQEESLEKLGADEFKLEQSYGFPYDNEEEVLVPCQERALHDAEERGLATEAEH